MRKIHKKQIMVKEGHASVDGIGCTVDTANLPSDWHAVTFYECADSGECYVEIEFVQDPFGGPKEFKGNKTISREEFENHSGCCDVFKQWMATPSYEEAKAEREADAEIELAEKEVDAAEEELAALNAEKNKVRGMTDAAEEIAIIDAAIHKEQMRLNKAASAKAKATAKKTAARLPREQRENAFLRDGMRAVPKKVL